MDDAITLLVRQRPEFFNPDDAVSPGSFKVVNPLAYHEGVVRNLEATGFCARFDGQEVQVKDSKAFSEQYSVLLSSQHIRRGLGSYRATCTPSAFPLDLDPFIHSVRVAFFGFRCPSGVDAPPNTAGTLPLGCVGFVTATPKDEDNRDVPPHVHGPDVRWSFDDSPAVSVTEFPDTVFNKTITSRRVGEFYLCAEIKGVQGCLRGRVF